MTRRRIFAKPLLLVLAVTFAAACSDDDGPTGLDPAVFELILVSGSAQSGLAGTVLDEPLVVNVRAKTGGAPEEGVTVRWRVVSGSGEPTRTTSVTDELGAASTRVALGSTAGDVRVEASVIGLPSVTFGPMTVLNAPTLVSVSPTAADPGDTVQVSVNNLPAAPATVQVLFDGVAGEITDQTPGSPSLIDVVVPVPVGVCSDSTQAVDVRLRVDGVTTAAVSLDVTVPADPFRVGQVLVIEGTSDVQCAQLPADGGSARYLVVALSAEFETDGLFQVTLGAGNVAVNAVDDPRPSANAGFHNRLRAVEARLARRGLPAAEPAAGPQLLAGPSLGDTRSFWVVNDIDAINQGIFTDETFDRVTATLEFIGGHTLLYMDNNAPVPGLTASDIQAIGTAYDRSLYDADVDFFGEPTDVDGNDKVVVLLSPVVNGLTDRDAEGVVIGFFFGLDLFPPNAAGCPECRFSNGSEILYGLVPDENGIHSDPRTKERVLELLPGVMAHETQHMISFRYKVFESPLPALETLWLSEGMAHAAEEKGGDIVDLAGDGPLADDLYEANFGRALRYLLAPDSASLTSVEGSGTLGERGAGWLFLRWIADQYGDFIFRDLTQSPNNGVSNIEGRTGESFFRLFADWAVALYADDLVIDGLADRYQVPKWQLRSIVKVDPPGGGDPVYALQPEQQTFTSFRGSQISQFMAGASPFYVELDADGDMGDLQLTLTAGFSAGLAILRIE
jgi:hypothetical protein